MECTCYFLLDNCKHIITSLSLLVDTTIHVTSITKMPPQLAFEFHRQSNMLNAKSALISGKYIQCFVPGELNQLNRKKQNHVSRRRCDQQGLRRGYKTFFILNNTEHEISIAHKSYNSDKYMLFFLSISQMLYLQCSTWINVKMPTIVGILTSISTINSCLVELSMKMFEILGAVNS